MEMMNCSIMTLLLFFAISASATASPQTPGDNLFIFSSTYQMQLLLRAELEFVAYLRRNLEKIKSWSESESFQYFIEDNYSAEKFVKPQNFESYVSNPFNSFGIMSRTSQAKHYFANFQEFQNLTSMFPPRKDFINACSAMILIQESLDLKTEDMVQGKIISKNGEIFWSDYKLGFVEFGMFGSVACINNFYDLCVQWLTHALKVRNQQTLYAS